MSDVLIIIGQKIGIWTHDFWTHVGFFTFQQVVNDIADWVLSDPFLVSAFTAFSKSKAADLMMDDNNVGVASNVRNVNGVGVTKRNSELLNSLLGLPKNILRSGRK